MSMVEFGLLFVVFVDVMGQGLLLPILDTLRMEPTAGFLPAGRRRRAMSTTAW